MNKTLIFVLAISIILIMQDPWVRWDLVRPVSSAKAVFCPFVYFKSKLLKETGNLSERAIFRKRRLRETNIK